MAMSKPLFLKLLLFQSFVVSAFLAAAVAYHGDLHPAAVVSGLAVLVVYAMASAYGLGLAYVVDTVPGFARARYLEKRLSHVGLAIRVLPMLAILGTASGFLIAFEGDVTQVQQRVAGASTGIITTILGVACTISLILQRHLLEES